MKNPLVAILLFVAALGGSIAHAYAAPLSVLGSTYSVYIEGSESDAGASHIGIFDGAPSPITRANKLLLLTESETELGGGKSRITVNVTGTDDIFPIAGETGIIGLGIDGNGLNFVAQVTLEQAILRLFTGTDLLFESDNLVPLLTIPLFPWDGTFPGTSNAFFIDTLGGLGITGLEFEFQVAGPAPQGPGEVPEPGSLLLGAIGLIALAGARRRRQRIVGSWARARVATRAHNPKDARTY